MVGEPVAIAVSAKSLVTTEAPVAFEAIEARSSKYRVVPAGTCTALVDGLIVSAVKPAVAD